MKGFIGDLLLLQALCLVWVPHVLAIQSLPGDVRAAANDRIAETMRVARQLRDDQRTLLTCAESLPAIQEALGDAALTSCQCLEIDGTQSSIVSCQDFCQLCRDELDLCVTYEYSFNFVAGNLNTFLGKLEYSGSRTDTLTFQETYSGNGQDIVACSTSVNDVQCTSCVPSTSGCIDGVTYDCSNIEQGAIFDECAGDFETIPVNSVFAAYNINFFNDADCIYFPTVSPAPTPALPTPPVPTGTMSPTRPPLITRTLNRFWIGVEYTILDDVEFSQTIIDYLTIQLSLFFPELGGVVLNRLEPNGPIPPDEVMFEFDGDAIFLDRAPNQLALEAAQRYILQNIVALQQAITANPNVGEDVLVVLVLISPDTLSPTPAPSPRPTPSTGYEKPPWGFKSMMKSMGKGSKGKGMMSGKSKGMSKKSMSYKSMGKKHAAPTYYGHQHVHDEGYYHHPWRQDPAPAPTPPAMMMNWHHQHHNNPAPAPPAMMMNWNQHHQQYHPAPSGNWKNNNGHWSPNPMTGATMTGTWVMNYKSKMHKSVMSGGLWSSGGGQWSSGGHRSMGGRWSSGYQYHAPTWQMRHRDSDQGYMSWGSWQNHNGGSWQMAMYNRWKYQYGYNMMGAMGASMKMGMGASKKKKGGYWH